MKRDSDYSKRKYEQFAHWIIESSDLEFNTWYEDNANENQRNFADRIIDEEEKENEEE